MYFAGLLLLVVEVIRQVEVLVVEVLIIGTVVTSGNMLVLVLFPAF